MPEPIIAPDTPGTLTVTAEQRQALAECVAIVAAHPHLHLSRRPTPFLMDLWATVALDETVEAAA